MLIDKEKLADIIPAIAAKMKFKPAIVEKDYYLTIILNNIDPFLSRNLVFKGGTLLNKIHLNYHRLSEDLDFSYYGKAPLKSRSDRSKAIMPIRNKMPNFLKTLRLKSDNPNGDGFNNSTQYVFKIQYPSFITGKDESIKLEISLRQRPFRKPVRNTITHFYQDVYTGENMIPVNKVLSLTLDEAVAEKLKAAISRKTVAIRDFYDLWHIAEAGFDFRDKKFIKLFMKKVVDEEYTWNFRENFGLNPGQLSLLKNQITTDLAPVIRWDETFDLNAVFKKFNGLFLDKNFK